MKHHAAALAVTLALIPPIAMAQAVLEGQLDRGVACAGRLAEGGFEKVRRDGGDCGFVAGYCMALGMDANATVPDSCLLVLETLEKDAELEPFVRGRITARMRVDFAAGAGRIVIDGAQSGAPAASATAIAVTPAKPTTAPQSQFNAGASTKGQCRIAEVDGSGVQDLEACFKLVKSCDAEAGTCALEFVWPSGSRTSVTAKGPRLDGATEINGTPTEANPDLRKPQSESDPLECAFSGKSKKAFCFTSTGF
ncbi:hypothetical protein IV417_05250 [Alphaproteobacteria bacterium KMM 3653]|uniref:Uncharacterized protein n=1 Tax=Harenicola maris TaxID=2841044 RepID=A0AAP2CQN5_9RHOB|nr:hypothetical protein [Harenicola maris]